MSEIFQTIPPSVFLLIYMISNFIFTILTLCKKEDLNNPTQMKRKITTAGIITVLSALALVIIVICIKSLQ